MDVGRFNWSRNCCAAALADVRLLDRMADSEELEGVDAVLFVEEEEEDEVVVPPAEVLAPALGVNRLARLDVPIFLLDSLVADFVV